MFTFKTSKQEFIVKIEPITHLLDIVSGAIREYSSPQVAATLHRSKYGSGHWRIKNCCNNVKGYNSAYGKKWYWKKDWVSMQQEK